MAADQPSISSDIKESIAGGSAADLAGPMISDLNTSEGAILEWLQQATLTSSEIEQLTKHGNAMKSRKVRLAVVKHACTPRHITLPLLRQLFTFDLMGVALSPTVPADIKHASEDVLIQRIESLSGGERLTLARRASGRVAGRLLLDSDSRVMRAALDNTRLTDALVIKAINAGAVTSTLVEAVCHHEKWSVRHEVRIALVGCDKTPSACVLAFARALPASLVQDVLHASNLPSSTKRHLRAELHIPD